MKMIKKKVARKSIARKREILASVLEIVRADGLRALSTERIARQANCSKETLYNWFDDRHGIMSALVKEQSLLLIAALKNSETDAQKLANIDLQLEHTGAALLDLVTGEASNIVSQIVVSESSEQLTQTLKNARYLEVEKIISPLLHTFAAFHQIGFEKNERNELFVRYYALLVGSYVENGLIGADNARPKPQEFLILSRRASRLLLCSLSENL